MPDDTAILLRELRDLLRESAERQRETLALERRAVQQRRRLAWWLVPLLLLVVIAQLWPYLWVTLVRLMSR